jgi:hypothetical protein
MKIDILAKLFGSLGRLKVIRMFLLNPEEIFPLKEILRRAKISKQAGRREINLLKEINFIALKKYYAETKNKKGKIKKKKMDGWKLNPAFPLLLPLKNFVFDAAPVSREELLKRLMKTGRLKMVILAGIFRGDENSRVDILVVGDAIRKKSLENVIKGMEAEIGKELSYAFLNTREFLYRLGMYDKFVRDILDYPHEKILNKLGI